MSTEQVGRSRRSSLSFKSITRMLSRDGRGPKKRPDSSNELRRSALASAASLTLPGASSVPSDTTSQDNIRNNGVPSTQPAGEGTSSIKNLEDSAKQGEQGLDSVQSHLSTSVPTVKGGQTDDYDPSTGMKTDYETKAQKKEAKRLQKEKEDLEKQSSRTEDADDNRESRPTKRESRRLSKKQPLRSSSRSSSVKSAMRSSITPALSSFRRSISGSRASSSHDNRATDTTEQGNQAADTGAAIPTLSGPWPERFGAAVSRELAAVKQPPYSPYSPSNQTERSLHSTGKFSDLRASARLSQTSGTTEKPRVQSMDVSFYQRRLSSDDIFPKESNKENKPNEGYRKSLVDPYTLIPYDTRDPEPETRSEQRTSGTPRFYANLHNIQGLAGSESTLKGVARRCPPAYTTPGETKQTGRSKLQPSNTAPITKSTVKTNGIWAPSGSTPRTENNRYTAVFKSSSTPIPTYTRENSQRNSLLPTRLRSKHTRFTSSPLAASSTDAPELESNLNEVNKSAPVLLPSQSPSVKPQLPELKYGETELFPSSQEGAGDSTDTVNSQPGDSKPTRDPPQPMSDPSMASSSRAPEGDKPLTSEAKRATPLRSYSSTPVSRKPVTKHLREHPTPTRSQTLPMNGQFPGNTAVYSAATPADTPGKPLKTLSHARVMQDAVTSVNSEETTSEKYNTASENASSESEPSQAAVSLRSRSPPSFNLFGNEPPPSNTVPQTHKNRVSLLADSRHASTLHTSSNLPANSSALRHTSHSGSIAKTFVICCQCNSWHDMPSDVYAKLTSSHYPDPPSPDAASGVDLSFKSRQLENGKGMNSRRRSSENKNNANINGNSALRTPVEANTAMKVAHNASNEEKANLFRGNDGKSRHSLSTPSPASSVKCCWCDHGIRKSCCAGWATTIHMQERHH